MEKKSQETKITKDGLNSNHENGSEATTAANKSLPMTQMEQMTEQDETMDTEPFPKDQKNKEMEIEQLPKVEIKPMQVPNEDKKQMVTEPIPEEMPILLTNKKDPIEFGAEVLFTAFGPRSGRMVLLFRKSPTLMNLVVYAPDRKSELSNLELPGLDEIPLAIECLEFVVESTDILAPKEGHFSMVEMVVFLVQKEKIETKDRILLYYISMLKNTFKPILISNADLKGSPNFLRIKSTGLDTKDGYFEMLFLGNNQKLLYAKRSYRIWDCYSQIKSMLAEYNGRKNGGNDRIEIDSTKNCYVDFTFDLSNNESKRSSRFAVLQRTDKNHHPASYSVFVCLAEEGKGQTVVISRVDTDTMSLPGLSECYFLTADFEEADKLYCFTNLSYSSKDRKIAVTGLSATKSKQLSNSQIDEWTFNVESHVITKYKKIDYEKEQITVMQLKQEYVDKFLKGASRNKDNIEKYFDQLKVKCIRNYINQYSKGDNGNIMAMYMIFEDFPYMYAFYLCETTVLRSGSLKYYNIDMMYTKGYKGEQPVHDLCLVPNAALPSIKKLSKGVSNGEVTVQVAFAKRKISSFISIEPPSPLEFPLKQIDEIIDEDLSVKVFTKYGPTLKLSYSN